MHGRPLADGRVNIGVDPSRHLSDLSTSTAHPWRWIPTLYFAQGLPYVVVMTLSVVMYKNLGVSNTEIALYTSWQATVRAATTNVGADLSLRAVPGRGKPCDDRIP